MRCFSKNKLPPMDGYYGRTQKIVWKPDWIELYACTNLGILGYLGEIKNFIMAIQVNRKTFIQSGRQNEGFENCRGTMGKCQQEENCQGNLISKERRRC